MFVCFSNEIQDFDNDAMGKTAFEDTYITMADIDGVEWVDNLRVRVSQDMTEMTCCMQAFAYWFLTPVVDLQMQNRDRMEHVESEQSWLLAKIV